MRIHRRRYGKRSRKCARLLQGSRSSAQYIITARMAVLVIYFLEAVQVKGNQSKRLAIAPSSIEFFFKRFSEEPAVMETGQGSVTALSSSLFTRHTR